MNEKVSSSCVHENDTISRKVATDAWRADFKGYVDCLDLPKDDYNGIMEYIDEAPYEQPDWDYSEETKQITLIVPEDVYNSAETIFLSVGYEGAFGIRGMVYSAQPERPKGHWIFVHPLQENDSGAYMCSECRSGDWDIDPVKDKFCKFCGADMRGECNE